MSETSYKIKKKNRFRKRIMELDTLFEMNTNSSNNKNNKKEKKIKKWEKLLELI